MDVRPPIPGSDGTLRIADLDRTSALYRRVGFKEIPEENQPGCAT